MGIENLSQKGLKTLINSYEAWAKTPEGQARLKEIEERKTFVIKSLPKGWDLDDGGEDEGYCVYSNFDEEVEISVELTIDRPVAFGGKQSYKVKIKEWATDEEDEDEDYEYVLKSFDAEENWKDAIQKANDIALDYMRKMSREI